ncbi:hypothetical protein [Nocardia paucivorans]|uniref:hypothetical protein n=1 Tax=Nocardia paucivorans TaxID=114259 RepID=UPI0002EE17C9|nr:hypothetical protein [Nocardia paucivorans]
MTKDVQNELQQWQQFKQQAINGEMRLEEGVGADLAQACENYRLKLQHQIVNARNLSRLSGFGGLPSALSIQDKFQRKAVGGGDNADDNAVKRLEQHIELAELMRDTYLAAIGKLQTTDHDTGTQLTNTGEGLR